MLAAALLGSKDKMPGPVGIVLSSSVSVLAKQVLEDAAKLAGDKLREVNAGGAGQAREP